MSSSDIAISVRGVCKEYRIAHEEKHTTLAEKWMVKLRSPLSAFRGAPKETFRALNDVSFDVKKGEVLGIIGRNGAGKSTLLKILSRITEPTKGEIKLYGRVASLLEVGTGFHPELTGRENIYLNGAILGMKRAEITRRFDEIVAFSEVEKFLDTPVKRYSSGMYVRLAFAVAAHLEPEILIVDEVLAVGDAEFQKKCLGKMKEVSRGGGRTVLFVSHNMRAISQLCSRGVFLRNGQVQICGSVEDATTEYLSHGGTTIDAVADVTNWTSPRRRGSALCRYTRFELLDAHGSLSASLRLGEPITVRMTVESSCDIPEVVLGFSFINKEGLEVLGTTAHDGGISPCNLNSGLQVLSCRVDPMILLPGRYVLRAAVFKSGNVFDHIDEVLSFAVTDVPWSADLIPSSHHVGLVYLPYRWRRH